MLKKALKIAVDKNHEPASAMKYARRYHRHLAMCSCWMCGNPRKHFKTATLQETKANAAAKDQYQQAGLKFLPRFTKL